VIFYHGHSEKSFEVAKADLFFYHKDTEGEQHEGQGEELRIKN
jgi:hypothetical protein